MRGLKIIGFVVGGLLLLMVLAIAGVVVWVQNGDMRGVASWAVKKQGYDIAFDGPVSVKLFPSGDVSVGKVVVMGGDNKPMFSTDEAHVAWNWGGGLMPWNGLQVTKVDAKNPTITLVRGKDGVANWETYMAKEAKAEGKPEAEEASAGSLPLGMLAATQLDIVNLNATYNDALSGQKVVARDVNLNATTNGTKAVTKLNGTVNDQKVAGELNVDLASPDEIPLVAKLNGAGLTVAMDGRVREQKSFAGLVNAQTGNLKQTLAALLGKAPEQAPAAEFRLSGDVDVGAEVVKLRNFSTRLGELLQASGDVEIAMGDKPSAKGDIRVQGSNLRQLAELGLGAAQPTIPATSFDVSTKLTGQDAIELKDLKVSLGTLLTMAGQVKVVPQGKDQPDVDANVTINAGSLQALLKAVGQTGTFPTKPLAAKVNVKGRGGSYELKDLNAEVADVATLTGNVEVATGKDMSVSGKLAVAGDNIKTAAAGFGVDASAIPASAFKVQTSLSGKGTIKADDLVIDMPNLLQATGKVYVTPGSPLNVVADMDVSRLNATALGYCAVDVPTQTAAPTEKAPASNAAAAPWSDEKINVDALRTVAFDIKVDAKGIDCARAPMDSLTAHVTNTPSQMDIEGLSMVFKDGGNAKLSGKLEHAGTPALQLAVTTSKLRIENLAPVLKSKGVQLPVDTNAQFASRGDTTRQLARNLEGTLHLSADEGKLPYTNMLGSASNLAAMIQGSSATTPNNGSGDVDSMKARYSIQQGVATTDELTVATGNGAMTLVGTGSVDLPNWVIDYKLTPSLAAGSNALAIPVLVKGPLTAPSIGADPAFVSKLSGRLAGEALKGVLGKEAGKAAGGVLGGVISGQGITKEGVGTLLDAFGNKKKGAVSGTEVSPTGAPAKPTLNDVFKAFGR